MPWAPDYATLPEARHYARIPEGDTADDAELTVALAAASRAIDRFANRQFGATESPVARYYTACFDPRRGRWVVDIDDLASSEGVVVETIAEDGTATAIPATVFTPVNAPADGRPWTGLRIPPASASLMSGAEDATRVTATWGWTTVPAPIKQACLLQVARLYKRRDAPFGIAGSPEIGSEMRLLNKLDPDVEVAVGPFVRQWGAA